MLFRSIQMRITSLVALVYASASALKISSASKFAHQDEMAEVMDGFDEEWALAHIEHFCDQEENADVCDEINEAYQGLVDALVEMEALVEDVIVQDAEDELAQTES